MMKECTKCREKKPVCEFYKLSRNKDGLNTRCKKCVKLANSQSHEKNKVSRNARKRAYYHETKEIFKEKRKSYTKRNKAKKAEYDREYRIKNKERIAKYNKEWESKRLESDLGFRILRNLRRRINHAIKGRRKSQATIDLVGCSIDEFLLHIEKQFVDGMSWENYGVNGWHIDHIKPCYTFDLNDPNQQKECFHYTNQRPMWAKDNLSRPRSI